MQNLKIIVFYSTLILTIAHCNPQGSVATPNIPIKPSEIPSLNQFPTRPLKPLTLPKGDPPKLCRQGFCFENPRPQGNLLNNGWGSSSNDMWVIGEGGTLLHYNGTNWSLVETGTFEPLELIWGSGPKDIWVMASDTSLLHYDGTNWNSQGKLDSEAPSHHYQSEIYLEYEQMTGFAKDDIWVSFLKRPSYQNNDLYHYNGTAWTKVTIPTTYTWDIWASKKGQLWIVGSTDKRTSIFQGDGTTWTEKLFFINTDPQKEYNYFSSITGTSETDIWAAAVHSIPRGPDAPRLILYHSSDGSKWNDQTPTLDPKMIKLNDPQIRSFKVNDVVLSDNVDSRFFLSYDGTKWSSKDVHIPLNTTVNTTQLPFWGFSSTDLWFIGSNTPIQKAVFHFDGSQVQDWNWDLLPGLEEPSPISWANEQPGRIFGTSPNNLWLGAYKHLLHSDGQTWTHSYDFPYSISSIFGFSPNDMWVGGYGNTLFHFNGNSWDQAFGSPNDQPLNNERITSIWGNSSDDVWAVGYYGFLAHYNGSTWVKVKTSPENSNFQKIFGFGPSDIWAVSDEGAIHYNGINWSWVNLPQEYKLLSVWGSNPHDVWLVGYSCKKASFCSLNNISWGFANSSILHFDGSQFTSVLLPSDFISTQALTDVWGSAMNDIWVVGSDGWIGHYDGTNWSTVLDGLTNESLYYPALFGFSATHELWVAGGSLLHRKD